MDTLFAHLVFAMGQAHETVATRGLEYILTRSDTARIACIRFLSRFGIDLPSETHFKGEVPGEYQERPDLVGFDAEGNSVVLIEAKFWAGLTENQPVVYLDGLSSTTPCLLFFLVPEARLDTIWSELRGRLEKAYSSVTALPRTGGSHLAEIDGHHRLAISTWEALLSLLRDSCDSEGDLVGEDVRQLMGFCERVDTEAFVPLGAEELSSAEIPRRILNFAELVDAVSDRLISEGLCSGKNLKATAIREGYGRYLMMDGGIGIYIVFNARLWLEFGDSPVWFQFMSSHTELARRALQEVTLDTAVREVYDGRLSLPVKLEPGAERDALVELCAKQIRSIHSTVAPHWPTEDDRAP